MPCDCQLSEVAWTQCPKAGPLRDGALSRYPTDCSRIPDSVWDSFGVRSHHGCDSARQSFVQSCAPAPQSIRFESVVAHLCPLAEACRSSTIPLHRQHVKTLVQGPPVMNEEDRLSACGRSRIAVRCEQPTMMATYSPRVTTSARDTRPCPTYSGATARMPPA